MLAKMGGMKKDESYQNGDDKVKHVPPIGPEANKVVYPSDPNLQAKYQQGECVEQANEFQDDIVFGIFGVQFCVSV
jgi:hypothetical protein